MNNNEFTTKNDFLYFQNEILGDIKNIQVKTAEKFTQLSNYLETQKNFNEKKFNDLTILIDKLSKKLEEKTDLEKFDDKLKQSLRSMQDLTVKLEIKFNIMNKDLKDACFKYDKIISNNLLVPGIVGSGCPYENLRYFIEFANVKIAELAKAKEKQNLDSKSYKEKMEGIISQNQYQFETMNVKFSNIIQDEITKNDNICKERISSVYQKIEKDKADNDKIMEEYKLILDKFGSDFGRFYQEDWINQHNLVNSLNHKIAKNAEEFHAFNHKLKELEELIKRPPTKRNSIIRRSNTIINKENFDNNASNGNNNQQNKRVSIKRIDIKRETQKTNNYIITSKRNNSNEPILSSKNNNIINNKEKKIFNKTFNKKEEQKIINIKEKSVNKNSNILNIQKIEEKNNVSNIVKSRNINSNANKFTNLHEVQNKSEINNNNNNKAVKKLDFKALNIKKREFKDNINENIKGNDNNNYDSNYKRGSFNDSYFYKVINFNDFFNNRNNLNNNKTTKSIEIGNNFSNNNTVDFKIKFNSNFNAPENIRLNNYSIGGEFSENDLHFVNKTKFNLSQAYLLAKAKLEEQQRLKPSKIFSNLSLNGNNTIKTLDKNKFKLNSKDNDLKNMKSKEKGISTDKYSNNHSSINDNTQDFLIKNFPSIYKNPQEIPDMHKNILHQKAMYLSYVNDNIGERNNKFDKDTNKTQIDYNNFNEKMNSKKLNRNKDRNKLRMVGSSSQATLLIKVDSMTPNMSNQFLNRSNNEERSFDLSYDKGSAKATLNHVKSFLIKKFKEDII